MRRNLILVAALALGACGGDDDGTSAIDASSVIDSGGGGSDGNTSDIDASGGGGGTQGPNQFCETLENGGPYCMEGLECCDDKVCRYTGDCEGSGGFVPCECANPDCPTGVCCHVAEDMDDFCTKRSACMDYDGTICQ
jgi:hypothetical protein